MKKLEPHHTSKSYHSEFRAQKAISHWLRGGAGWSNGKYTIFQMIHTEGKHAGKLRFHPILLGTENLHAIHVGFTVWAFG